LIRCIQRLKYNILKEKIKKLINLKQYDNALNFVNKIKECKKDVGYMLEIGQLLKAASDYAGAIKWFKQVLKTDVKNKYALRGLVESLTNAGRYSELTEYIECLNKKERFIIMNKTVEKYINSEDIDSLKRLLKHNKILKNNKNMLSVVLHSIGDKMYTCEKHDTERQLTELLKKYVKFLPDSLKLKVGLYYNEKKNIKETIRWFSYIKSNLINQKKIISLIVNMLRKEVILKNDVKNILKNLNTLHTNIKDIKLKNLILGETEILQNKIILKSKPVKMHVVLTTKCNLKCIMCNVCTNEYTISKNYIEIIKGYLPYLEEISWQGGELFLYDKFEELIKLAAKYKVEQEFVTNGLLLDKRRIEMVAKLIFFFHINRFS
jgi:tetratricopeptide (TPR) repeat protein